MKYDGLVESQSDRLFLVFSAETIFTRYQDKVKYWMTFNEINFLRSWTQIGIHKNDKQHKYPSCASLVLASAKAVQMGHRINPDFMIGMMVAYIPSYPMTANPEDVLAALQFNREQEFYIDVQAKGYYPAHKGKKSSNVKGSKSKKKLEMTRSLRTERLTISVLAIICQPLLQQILKQSNMLAATKCLR